MKKAEGIKILESRFTWFIVASALGAIGVTIPPDTLMAAGQVIAGILESVK